MAALTLGYRQSAAESFDDNRSRYVPSSVYSGPGPEVDVPPPIQPVQPVQLMYQPNRISNGGRNGYNGVSTYSAAFTPRPRTSDALNINDPVAIHLLTETALGDSKNFEILSFEELEQLKIEKQRLRNKVQALKRKIGLECKLRDAAQSLNRLYARTGKDGSEARGHRRNLTSSSKGSSDMSSRAEDEYTASIRKVEELTEELEVTKENLDDVQRRILEHTAGILQTTHRGLKKNLRKHELPRSPESMASPGQRSISGGPLLDEFDERSLYPVPDYVNEFIGSSPMTPMLLGSSSLSQGSQNMDSLAHRLSELSARLHGMAVQMYASQFTTEPPELSDLKVNGKVDAHIDAHLDFLSQGLESLANAQQRTMEESDNVTVRLDEMLEKTKSISRSPVFPQEEKPANDLTSQLAFSTRVLEQLHTRVESLVEQKDILTRQIQQQRELNTKSDAQRDAQIHDLTEELAEMQKQQESSEQEVNHMQNQISQLMDQLDRAREDNHLIQQQQGMNDNKALNAEREARKRAETELNDQIQNKQHANEQLQAELNKLQHEVELRSQQQIQQLNESKQAKEQAEVEARNHHSEAEKLLGQIASIQTELVMAKAELDGAYGSRAERAADVSSNPAVQKQIDSLQSKNDELQRELKDTIEDYEQMTKASIEFEKERDKLEASIDSLRDKCEGLESQLNEEKLKALGTKTPVTNDTTSTTVLKNEFKKMMRDTKAASLKAIRHEQEERRKLEGIIRQMKKDMGISTPIKSNINTSNQLTRAETPI